MDLQNNKQEENGINYQQGNRSLLISSTSTSTTGVSNMIASETYDDALFKTSKSDVDLGDISTTESVITQENKYKENVKPGNYQHENKQKSRIDQQDNKLEKSGNNYQQDAKNSLISTTSRLTTHISNMIASETFDDALLKTRTSDVDLGGISTTESALTHENQYKDYINPGNSQQENKLKSRIDQRDNIEDENENNYQQDTESKLIL